MGKGAAADTEEAEADSETARADTPRGAAHPAQERGAGKRLRQWQSEGTEEQLE